MNADTIQLGSMITWDQLMEFQKLNNVHGFKKIHFNIRLQIKNTEYNLKKTLLN